MTVVNKQIVNYFFVKFLITYFYSDHVLIAVNTKNDKKKYNLKFAFNI